jgi:hypothetical protein
MTEDSNNKHSKMTLMSFNEAIEYASTPQAEGRIGHEGRVKDIYKEMLKENRDRRPGSDWEPSVFLRMEDN